MTVDELTQAANTISAFTNDSVSWVTALLTPEPALALAIGSAIAVIMGILSFVLGAIMAHERRAVSPAGAFFLLTLSFTGSGGFMTYEILNSPADWRQSEAFHQYSRVRSFWMEVNPTEAQIYFPEDPSYYDLTYAVKKMRSEIRSVGKDRIREALVENSQES